MVIISTHVDQTFARCPHRRMWLAVIYMYYDDDNPVIARNVQTFFVDDGVLDVPPPPLPIVL